MSAKLTPYQDIPVLGTTVSIRNTGDGLSKAMKVDPVELEIGSKVYVVLECEVEKHRHEPTNADAPRAGLTLVNMLKAGAATMVDGKLVRNALDQQAKAIEEAEGVQRLPGTDTGDTEGTVTDIGDAKAKK